MSRGARTALLLAALAVAVLAAVVIGTGGDDEEATTPATAPATAPATTGSYVITKVVRLRDGRPVNGVSTSRFESGEQVRFTIESDTEQEIHVHGYDITKTVPAGGRTTFAFRAQAQGVFEVEAHSTEQPVLRLKIVP